ncbi:unnamed protein product [Blepharisma stoltei]|uniref:Uncharacterized protein n=1 Tax=Blepharisma stoltei TaxID=1481888 RepID=A0AAU9JSP2_9CILI|nr:unnamed protein product [Blepharisma stoltei]
MDQNKANLFNCAKSIEDYISKLKPTQRWGLDQHSIDQLLNPKELENKRSVLLKRAIGPTIERDFRTTYLFYKNQSSRFDEALSKAYNEYITTYHHFSSLYFISEANSKNHLYVYNTESETKENKILEISESLDCFYAAITQLPNGELFVVGKNGFSESTFIIDRNYEFRKLQYESYYFGSSAIYLNRNVYCFGEKWNDSQLARSRRYDFDRNCWFDIAPMPQAYYMSHSVIFKGDILISGLENKHLLLYSIDIDSYSTIPYEFSICKRKILINVEERLYLFECRNGFIYESDVGNEYAWKKIKENIISDNPFHVNCSYNKGGIYIGTLQNDEEPHYYRFSLGLKLMTKL